MSEYKGDLYFCNKCGFFGDTERHKGCDYLAAPSAETMLRKRVTELEAELARVWALMPELRNAEPKYELHEAVHEKLARVRNEALEDAAVACDEVKSENERWGAHMYDMKAHGADECAVERVDTSDVDIVAEYLEPPKQLTNAECAVMYWQHVVEGSVDEWKNWEKLACGLGVIGRCRNTPNFQDSGFSYRYNPLPKTRTVTIEVPADMTDEEVKERIGK